MKCVEEQTVVILWWKELSPGGPQAGSPAVQRLNEPRPLSLGPRRIHLTSASYEASSQPKRMELLLFGRRLELCNPFTLPFVPTC